MAKTPEFQTLDEAVEFWESHDSTDYWEEMAEVQFDVDLHQNLLHPKLVALTHRPEHCPRCQQKLNDTLIEYVASNNGRLLIIRDVPVLQCQTFGHEYILEQTIDKVEQLLRLEKKERIQPARILKVPVFSLKAAVAC